MSPFYGLGILFLSSIPQESPLSPHIFIIMFCRLFISSDLPFFSSSAFMPSSPGVLLFSLELTRKWLIWFQVLLSGDFKVVLEILYYWNCILLTVRLIYIVNVICLNTLSFVSACRQHPVIEWNGFYSMSCRCNKIIPSICCFKI